MSEELITAVKYPPFRAPRCQYNSAGALGGFRISYFSSGVTNALLTNITVGIADDSTLPNYDNTNNYVTLGPTTNRWELLLRFRLHWRISPNPYSFDNIQLLFDIDEYNRRCPWYSLLFIFSLEGLTVPQFR